jgi:SAM-dependent methyltransferase
VSAKYDAKASRWTEGEYADAGAYLEHRARLVVELGPRLRPGDRVCDLACGDGGLGEHLLAHGLEYLGVDASGEMVDAARRRLGERAELVRADLNQFVPERPVAAVTCFRAIYYARDRRAFFAHVADFGERKLVFDLNPRQFALRDVLADLRAAGFAGVELRPFFVPQRVALPRTIAWAFRAAEQAGPLARLALRLRFTYLVAAWRHESDTANV